MLRLDCPDVSAPGLQSTCRLLHEFHHGPSLNRERNAEEQEKGERAELNTTDTRQLPVGECPKRPYPGTRHSDDRRQTRDKDNEEKKPSLD